MSDKDKFVKQQLQRNNQQAGGNMTKSQLDQHKKTTESFWEKWFGNGKK